MIKVDNEELTITGTVMEIVGDVTLVIAGVKDILMNKGLSRDEATKTIQSIVFMGFAISEKMEDRK